MLLKKDSPHSPFNKGGGLLRAVLEQKLDVCGSLLRKRGNRGDFVPISERYPRYTPCGNNEQFFRHFLLVPIKTNPDSHQNRALKHY